MTPTLLTPMMLLGFLREHSASECSALIVAFTALVYLVMTCTPFLRSPDSKPPEPKQAEDTFHRGGQK